MGGQRKEWKPRQGVERRGLLAMRCVQFYLWHSDGAANDARDQSTVSKLLIWLGPWPALLAVSRHHLKLLNGGEIVEKYVNKKRRKKKEKEKKA